MKKRKSLLRKGLPHFLKFKIKNTEYIHGGNVSGVFNAGNGAGDLNPADIESVTVLPSANAAALYGNRARKD